MTDEQSASLRRLPSQDRSTQRFALILDTVAELIDESGYGSLSIALIAKRAGISSPGIYRYFDGLQAIVLALATRNRERLVERASRMLGGDVDNWHDAISGLIDLYRDLYRDEPGFRWLGLGDVVDKNLFSTTETNLTVISGQISQLFVDRYEVLPRPDMPKHVEVAVTIAERLVAKAFETAPGGDPFFIEECKRVTIGYVEEYLARPIP